MSRWVIALLLITSAAQAEVRHITISSGGAFIGILPELILRRDHLLARHAAALGVPDLTVNWVTRTAEDDLASGKLSFQVGEVFELLPTWAKSRGTPNAVLGVTGVSQTLIDDVPTDSQIVWTTQRFASENPRVVKAVFASYANVVDTINRDEAAAADLYATWSHFPANRQFMFSALTEPIPNNTGHVVQSKFTQTPGGIMFWAKATGVSGLGNWTDVFLPIAHGLPGS